MKDLRGLGELSRAYLLQAIRSKTSIFWALVFPQVWLFAFAFIFGPLTPGGVSYLLPGLFALTTMAGSFFGVSYLMVNERENEVLRRYRVTPVSPVTVVLANGVRSMATVTASLLLQWFLAWLFFGITIEGSILYTVLVLLVGALAFVSLGLILGCIAKDMRTAPALANLIFFPMMFLSGAAIPFFLLPGWIQVIARLMPATYLIEALQGVMVRGESFLDVAGPIVVLLVTAVLAAAFNSLVFRWESSEPINYRKLAVAIGGLAILYLAAAMLAPAMRMATSPAQAAGEEVAAARTDRDEECGLLISSSGSDDVGRRRGWRVARQVGA
jgi:ABC-2 type transport system permease protein